MAENQRAATGHGQSAATREAPDDFDRLMQGHCSYRPFAEHQDIKISPQIILKYLCRPTKSGVCPDDQQIMKFQMLCRSRQLNPFEGDAYLIGYDGKYGPEWSIQTAIQAMYKRAEGNPNYDGIESGVIVIDSQGQIVQRQGDYCHPGDKLVGGWANVHRKDQSHPTVERINLENRDKNRSVWNSDKSGMIVKCAEAGALRRAFPSQLSALYVREEAALMAASAEDAGGKQARATAMIEVDKVLGRATETTSAPGGTAEEAPKPRPDPATQAEVDRQVKAVREAGAALPPAPPQNRTMTGEPWPNTPANNALTGHVPDEEAIPFGNEPANEEPDPFAGADDALPPAKAPAPGVEPSRASKALAARLAAEAQEGPDGPPLPQPAEELFDEPARPGKRPK